MSDYDLPGSYEPKNFPEAVLFADRWYAGDTFFSYLDGFLHGAGSPMPTHLIGKSKTAKVTWARAIIDGHLCLRCEYRRIDHAADGSCYTEGDEKFVDGRVPRGTPYSKAISKAIG